MLVSPTRHESRGPFSCSSSYSQYLIVIPEGAIKGGFQEKATPSWDPGKEETRWGRSEPLGADRGRGGKAQQRPHRGKRASSWLAVGAVEWQGQGLAYSSRSIVRVQPVKGHAAGTLRTVVGQDLSPAASRGREIGSYSFIHHLLNNVTSKYYCIYGSYVSI